MIQVVLTFLAVGVAISTAALTVESLGDDNEGPCAPLQPIKANREFIDSLHYSVGGNRLTLYHLVRALPTTPKVRDEDFYYDACFTRNANTLENGTTAFGYGFGQQLTRFRVLTRPGIYAEAVNLGGDTDPSISWDSVVETVTLTDHRSFAFLVQCYPKLNLRGWLVTSLTPNLEPRARRIIEEHAVSLGFSMDKFIFFRFDSCRLGLGNPNLSIYDLSRSRLAPH